MQYKQFDKIFKYKSVDELKSVFGEQVVAELWKNDINKYKEYVVGQVQDFLDDIKYNDNGQNMKAVAKRLGFDTHLSKGNGGILSFDVETLGLFKPDAGKKNLSKNKNQLVEMGGIYTNESGKSTSFRLLRKDMASKGLDTFYKDLFGQNKDAALGRMLEDTISILTTLPEAASHIKTDKEIGQFLHKLGINQKTLIAGQNIAFDITALKKGTKIFNSLIDFTKNPKFDSQTFLKATGINKNFATKLDKGNAAKVTKPSEYHPVSVEAQLAYINKKVPGIKGNILGANKEFHTSLKDVRQDQAALAFFTRDINKLFPGASPQQIKAIATAMVNLNGNDSYYNVFAGMEAMKGSNYNQSHKIGPYNNTYDALKDVLRSPVINKMIRDELGSVSVSGPVAVSPIKAVNTQVPNISVAAVKSALTGGGGNSGGGGKKMRFDINDILKQLKIPAELQGVMSGQHLKDLMTRIGTTKTPEEAQALQALVSSSESYSILNLIKTLNDKDHLGGKGMAAIPSFNSNKLNLTFISKDQYKGHGASYKGAPSLEMLLDKSGLTTKYPKDVLPVANSLFANFNPAYGGAYIQSSYEKRIADLIRSFGGNGKYINSVLKNPKDLQHFLDSQTQRSVFNLPGLEPANYTDDEWADASNNAFINAMRKQFTSAQVYMPTFAYDLMDKLGMIPTQYKNDKNFKTQFASELNSWITAYATRGTGEATKKSIKEAEQFKALYSILDPGELEMFGNAVKLMSKAGITQGLIGNKPALGGTASLMGANYSPFGLLSQQSNYEHKQTRNYTKTVGKTQAAYRGPVLLSPFEWDTYASELGLGKQGAKNIVEESMYRQAFGPESLIQKAYKNWKNKYVQDRVAKGGLTEAKAEKEFLKKYGSQYLKGLNDGGALVKQSVAKEMGWYSNKNNNLFAIGSERGQIPQEMSDRMKSQTTTDDDVNFLRRLLKLKNKDDIFDISKASFDEEEQIWNLPYSKFRPTDRSYKGFFGETGKFTYQAVPDELIDEIGASLGYKTNYNIQMYSLLQNIKAKGLSSLMDMESRLFLSQRLDEKSDPNKIAEEFNKLLGDKMTGFIHWDADKGVFLSNPQILQKGLADIQKDGQRTISEWYANSLNKLGGAIYGEEKNPFKIVKGSNGEVSIKLDKFVGAARSNPIAQEDWGSPWEKRGMHQPVDFRVKTLLKQNKAFVSRVSKNANEELDRMFDIVLSNPDKPADFDYSSAEKDITDIIGRSTSIHDDKLDRKSKAELISLSSLNLPEAKRLELKSNKITGKFPASQFKDTPLAALAARAAASAEGVDIGLEGDAFEFLTTFDNSQELYQLLGDKIALPTKSLRSLNDLLIAGEDVELTPELIAVNKLLGGLKKYSVERDPQVLNDTVSDYFNALNENVHGKYGQIFQTENRYHVGNSGGSLSLAPNMDKKLISRYSSLINGGVGFTRSDFIGRLLNSGNSSAFDINKQLRRIDKILYGKDGYNRKLPRGKNTPEKDIRKQNSAIANRIADVFTLGSKQFVKYGGDKGFSMILNRTPYLSNNLFTVPSYVVPKNLRLDNTSAWIGQDVGSLIRNDFDGDRVFSWFLTGDPRLLEMSDEDFKKAFTQLNESRDVTKELTNFIGAYRSQGAAGTKSGSAAAGGDSTAEIESKILKTLDNSEAQALADIVSKRDFSKTGTIDLMREAVRMWSHRAKADLTSSDNLGDYWNSMIANQFFEGFSQNSISGKKALERYIKQAKQNGQAVDFVSYFTDLDNYIERFENAKEWEETLNSNGIPNTKDLVGTAISMGYIGGADDVFEPEYTAAMIGKMAMLDPTLQFLSEKFGISVEKVKKRLPHKDKKGNYVFNKKTKPLTIGERELRLGLVGHNTFMASTAEDSKLYNVSGRKATYADMIKQQRKVVLGKTSSNLAYLFGSKGTNYTADMLARAQDVSKNNFIVYRDRNGKSQVTSVQNASDEVLAAAAEGGNQLAQEELEDRASAIPTTATTTSATTNKEKYESVSYGDSVTKMLSKAFPFLGPGINIEEFGNELAKDSFDPSVYKGDLKSFGRRYLANRSGTLVHKINEAFSIAKSIKDSKMSGELSKITTYPELEKYVLEHKDSVPLALKEAILGDKYPGAKELNDRYLSDAAKIYGVGTKEYDEAINKIGTNASGHRQIVGSVKGATGRDLATEATLTYSEYDSKIKGYNYNKQHVGKADSIMLDDEGNIVVADYKNQDNITPGEIVQAWMYEQGLRNIQTEIGNYNNTHKKKITSAEDLGGIGAKTKLGKLLQKAELPPELYDALINGAKIKSGLSVMKNNGSGGWYENIGFDMNDPKDRKIIEKVQRGDDFFSAEEKDYISSKIQRSTAAGATIGNPDLSNDEQAKANVEFGNLMNERLRLTKEFAKTEKALNTTPAANTRLREQLTTNLTEISDALNENGESLKYYNDLVSDGVKNKHIEKFEKQMASFQRSLNLQNGGARNVWESLAGSFKNMLYYFTSMGAAYMILGKIKQGIQQVVQASTQLDQVMVNLRIVTGDTDEQVKSLLTTYSSLGKQLGATTTEVATAANEWLRQGYEVNQVNELITASLYLSKLGMTDVSTATKVLTSTLKGFKLEASDAVSVVDKLTKLDMSAAISAAEIGTGLAQFAATGSLAGLDVDKASALVTTIADVSQKSGSEVGNALRTIISRYSNVKAGAFGDLSTEGDSGDTQSKLNDVEKVLNKIGISLRSSNLEFRNFDEVLDDLAEKWNTLDNVSKRAVSTAFAGVRQQEYFNILMENYDKYEEFLEISQNSEGTAEKKYESYLDHLEASKKKLQSSWEDLAKNANINDFLNKVTKFTSFLVDKLPVIIRYTARIGATMASIKLPKLFSNFGSMFGLGILQKGPAQYLGKNGNILSPAAFANLSKEQQSEFTKIGSNLWYNKKAAAADKYISNEAYAKMTPEQRAGYKQLKNFDQDAVTGGKGVLGTISNNVASILNVLTSNKAAAASGTTDGQLVAKTDNGKAMYQHDDGQWYYKNGHAVPPEQMTNYQKQLDDEAAAMKQQSAMYAKQQKMMSAMVAGMAILSAVLTAPKTHKNRAVRTVNGERAWAAEDVEATQEASMAGSITNVVTTTAGAVVGTVLGKSAQGTAIGAQAGGTLGDLLSRYIVMPLIDANYNERQERVKIAERQLAALNSISNNISSLSDLAGKSWGFEEYSEAEKSIQDIVDALYTEETEEVRELINNLLSEFTNENTTISDITSKYLSSTSSERKQLIYALQVATSQAKAEEAYAANEAKYNELANRYNNKELDRVWGQLSGSSEGFSTKSNVGRVYNQSAADIAAAYESAGFTVNYKAGFWGGVLDAVSLGYAASTKPIIDTSEMTLEEQKEAFTKLYEDAQRRIDNAGENASVSTLYDLKESTADILNEIESILVETEKINKQLNTNYVEAAALTTEVDGSYLMQLSELQLKNLGVDEIKMLLAKSIQESGGLIGHEVFYEGDNGTTITSYAESMIDTWMKSQESFYNVLTGQSYTLQEAIKYNEEHPGDTSLSVLQNFANALGVSVEDLKNNSAELFAEYGNRTLGDLLATPEETRQKIADCANLIKQMATSTGLLGENIENIITNFPSLIPYLSDEAALVSQLMADIDSYRKIWGKNIYNSIVSNTEYYQNTLLPGIEKLLTETEWDQFSKEAGSATSADDLISWISQGGELADKVGEYINSAISQKITSSIDQTIIDNIKQYQSQYLDKQIQNLNDQKDALSEINKQREYENELIEAKLKLENAQKEKKRVWREGVGWTYETDQEAVKEAQENLDEVTNQKTISALEAQIKVLQADKDLLDNLDSEKAFEKMQVVYEEWAENNKLTIQSNDDLIRAMYDYLNNTSKYDLTDNFTDSIEQKKKDTQQALYGEGGLSEAWDTLKNTSKTDANYNAVLNNYKSLYQNAVDKGYINDSNYKQTNNGKVEYIDESGDGLFSRKAYDQAVNGQEVTPDYYYEVSKDGKTYRLFESGNAAVDGTVVNTVWEKMKKGKATMWTESMSAFNPSKTKGYEPEEYDSLKEYAKAHPGAIIMGKNKNWISTRQRSIHVLGGGTQKIDGEVYGINTYLERPADWPDNLYTGSLSAEGLTFVNELGTEAIITPQGTLTALPSNTGVVPADITKNLWQLGEVAPSIMRTLERHLSDIKFTGIGTGTDESFNVGTINMTVNADDTFDIDQFVDSIKTRAALTKNTNR